eukprot:15191383-Alexandrium_andersonii.AAC.1
METEELRPAPATPHTAMNRLGWTAEQVEARRKLEEAGQLEAWGDIAEDAESDAAFEDAYFGGDHFMGGEEGGDLPAEGEDAVPIDSAPERSRSGDKIIPRRPKPSPSGPAAVAAPGDPAAEAAPKSSRAEPAEVDFSGQRLRVIDLGGDGDCGYRAIGAAVALTGGVRALADITTGKKAENLGVSLRTKCHRRIIADAEFRGFFVPVPEAERRTEALEPGEAPPCTWEEYKLRIAREKRWIDGIGIGILAACEVL